METYGGRAFCVFVRFKGRAVCFCFLPAPVFHSRSAAGGIIHLTFGFARADEIVQVPPHRHLGKAGVGGDLFGGAVGACIFAQVGPDMVRRLPLDALFQLSGAAFRVRAAGADHLVDVGLGKFQPALDDLAAHHHFIQRFFEPLIPEGLDKVVHHAQPQSVLNVGRIAGDSAAAYASAQ